MLLCFLKLQPWRCETEMYHGGSHSISKINFLPSPGFLSSVKSARSYALYITDEQHKCNYRDSSESFIWIKRGNNLLTCGAAHALHILWRRTYSIKLINNHYPPVTSFSLLGTPIALAESFAAKLPCLQLSCEVFGGVCLLIQPESDANVTILFAWRTHCTQLVKWAHIKESTADDRDAAKV